MAGYSKTPLIGKLGLKPGMKVAFVAMPAEVRDAIALPNEVAVLKRPGTEMDYVHYFAESEAKLTEVFPALKQSLSRHGMLWISWRKGKKGTEITEDIVRKVALQNGLVDAKVCAIDETWSALKLVYRVKDR